MASHLSGVYLLSFCLIGLNDGSIPNLCLITSLGILGISDIFHAKTSRLSQRKVTSLSSYLGLGCEPILSFLSRSSGLARTSLLFSSSVIHFFLSFTFGSMGDWAEVEVVLTIFCPGVATSVHGVLLSKGLTAAVLRGALPP
jgi:hypothetical protein